MGNLIANLLMKKTPYNLKELADVIDASYSAALDKDEFVQKTSFSPSVVGYGSGTCPRRWVLLFNGAHQRSSVDPISVDNMTNGTDAHRRIQDNVENSDLKCINEFELYHNDPPIHGFVDMIIEDFNGYNLVVEIKTTRSEAWESRRLKNAGPEYQRLQLLIYLYLLKEKYGVLLYENKNDHRKIMIPVELNDVTTAIVEKVFEWMRAVYAMHIDGELPKNPFRKNSKICNECPIKSWCYEQPEGTVDFPQLEYAE